MIRMGKSIRHKWVNQRLKIGVQQTKPGHDIPTMFNSLVTNELSIWIILHSFLGTIVVVFHFCFIFDENHNYEQTE